MPLNSICRTIAFSALCVSVAWARGGENPRQLSGESAVLLMQDAARLIASRSLGAAEASYNTILQGHPDNKEARLARGHVRAWQHKYEEARDDFLAVLRLDPNNLSALDGLGYSFAWAGAYDEGEKWFRRGLGTAPGQIEATRGLAYVALWRGDVREAIRRFEGLLAQAPSDADAVAGLGQAYLAANRKREAREAFQRVQQLDPGRTGELAATLHDPPGCWVARAPWKDRTEDRQGRAGGLFPAGVHLQGRRMGWSSLRWTHRVGHTHRYWSALGEALSARTDFLLFKERSAR